MSEKQFDMLGKEVHPGCRIVYPGRYQGVEALVVAQVISIPNVSGDGFVVMALACSHPKGPVVGTKINRFKKVKRCLVIKRGES